ncbi:MAG: DUF502 domain-containing protein [Flavobacteriales bacterium]|nr:DUF502 domain-containing protein [Flavobacteriales bacterium]
MQSILNFFKKYFLRGLLYTLPVVITVYTVYLVFDFLGGLIPGGYKILNVIILLAFVTFMGFLGSSLVAEPIKDYFRNLLDRAPLLKTIYAAIRDLLSAFVGDKKRFDKPVLVKVNKNSDLEKLGFITGEDLSHLGIASGKVAVYLPHSYNFSGNLFIVPIENVTPIDKPASEVMKYIVSGGVADVGNE